MGEFVGIVRWDGAAIEPATRASLIAGIQDQPRAALWHDSVAAIAERPATRANHLPSPQLCTLPDARILVADLRLDERADTARVLGLHASTVSDLAILSAACERWGDDAPARLYGDFSYALWDPHRHRLTLARSALGTRTLYFANGPGWTIFATTFRGMLRLPHVSRALDDFAIANYLTGVQDQDRTLYRDIYRVPPGGTTSIARGIVSIARYWTAETIPETRFARDDDYACAAREALDRAVANRLPLGPVAVMMSGGFDSTAIAVTAARLLGQQNIIAYSRMPGKSHAEGMPSERLLAGEVAASHDNIDWRQIDEDTVIAPEAFLDGGHGLLGMARMGSLNTDWYDPLFRAAERDGIDTLFNGVTGNMTLTWDGAPPYAQYLRTGRLIALGLTAWRTARITGRPVSSVLAHDVLSALKPHGVQRFRKRRGNASWLGYTALRGEFLTEIGYADYVDQIGHDRNERRNENHVAQRVERLHLQYQRDILSANRFRFGFERQDPMSDRRLAELTLGMPLDQYVRDGEDRWLARRALADRLPADVLEQRRRATQLPEWHHIVTEHRQTIGQSLDLLERSPSIGRVLDLPRLRRLHDEWPEDLATSPRQHSDYRTLLLRAVALGNFLRWHETA